MRETRETERKGCFYFFLFGPLMFSVFSFSPHVRVDSACMVCACGFIPDFENIVSISDAIGSSLMIKKKECKFSWNVSAPTFFPYRIFLPPSVRGPFSLSFSAAGVFSFGLEAKVICDMVTSRPGSVCCHGHSKFIVNGILQTLV